MSKSGPARTPTAILALRGSWRAKTRPNEPKAPAGRPACPRDFDEERKRVFRALLRLLESMGLLSKVDGFPLERYADSVVRWRRLRVDVQQKGEYEMGTQLVNVPRAAVAILRNLAAELERTEKLFGLNPSARASLAAEGIEPHGAAKEREEEPQGKDRFFSA